MSFVRNQKKLTLSLGLLLVLLGNSLVAVPLYVVRSAGSAAYYKGTETDFRIRSAGDIKAAWYGPESSGGSGLPDRSADLRAWFTSSGYIAFNRDGALNMHTFWGDPAPGVPKVLAINLNDPYLG